MCNVHSNIQYLITTSLLSFSEEALCLIKSSVRTYRFRISLSPHHIHITNYCSSASQIALNIHENHFASIFFAFVFRVYFLFAGFISTFLLHCYQFHCISKEMQNSLMKLLCIRSIQRNRPMLWCVWKSFYFTSEIEYMYAYGSRYRDWLWPRRQEER